ncbi:hypothetical protein HY251_05190 [bacterium]|nr:hypothetical protein [bacterium]
MTRLACSCGKEYSVRDRAPGTRVRCRACQAVLVVPEPRSSPAVRNASERLRQERAEVCIRHPKNPAVHACSLCALPICASCVASPASHLCRPCAARVGTTEAVRVPIGAFGTSLVVARTLRRAFLRLLVLNVLLRAFNLVALVGILILAYFAAGWVPNHHPVPGSFEDIRWKTTGVLTVAAIVLVLGLVSAVLIPAADIHILDGAVREKERPFFEDIVAAVRRAWRRKWALLWTYCMLLGAAIPPLLAFAPFGFGAVLLDSKRAFALGIVVTLPMLGVSFAVFGLALPAVVLEHRSGASALLRAWALARRRLLLTCALGAGFVVAFLVAGALLEQVRFAFASTRTQVGDFLDRVAGGLGLLAFDLAWPSLLVSLYHGLVADEEGLTP